MENKKVMVLGATGSIGKRLYRSLKEKGYKIYVASRNIEGAKKLFPDAEAYFEYNILKPDDLSEFINGIGAVVNLAGAPIFAHWKGGYEKEVVDSRVKGTSYVVEAIAKCEKKPEVLINGSAAGIYGYSENVAADENSPAGKDFWGQLVLAWEKEAYRAENLGVRVVTVRTTLVLEKGEGALDALVPYFKKGIGGYVRPGNQLFPWIHMEDEIGIITSVMEDSSFKGPINCVGGNCTSRAFSESIGKALNKRAGLPIPGFVIKFLFGRGSDLVLKSQSIKSEKIESIGYGIKFADINAAMEDILKTEKERESQ